MTPTHCIECGCNDLAACHDEVTGGHCSWLVVDRQAAKDLCSACPEGLDRWSAGDREFDVPVDQIKKTMTVLEMLALAAEALGYTLHIRGTKRAENVARTDVDPPVRWNPHVDDAD